MKQKLALKLLFGMALTLGASSHVDAGAAD